MKTLNIKGDGTLTCHWGLNGVITTTNDPNISTEIKNEIDSLMAELQSDGFQEIHFEYGNGRNFTHKSGSNNVVEITNTDNNLFTTMETWASELIGESSDDPPEGSGD